MPLHLCNDMLPDEASGAGDGDLHGVIPWRQAMYS